MSTRSPRPCCRTSGGSSRRPGLHRVVVARQRPHALSIAEHHARLIAVDDAADHGQAQLGRRLLAQRGAQLEILAPVAASS